MKTAIIKSLAIASLFAAATNAMAVGAQFEKRNVTAVNDIATLHLQIYNQNDKPMKIELEMLDGNPLPDFVKSTLPLNNIVLTPKQNRVIPLYMKLPEKGTFSVSVCAKEEPLLVNRTADGVSVNVVVRACGTAEIVNK